MADDAPKKPRKSAAAKAREAEAAGDFLFKRYAASRLRIPIRNIPIGAMDAARAGADSYDILKEMLGEEQWKALSNARAGSRDID
jgi:hypothetical protein